MARPNQRHAVFQLRKMIAHEYRELPPFAALDQMLGDNWVVVIR